MKKYSTILTVLGVVIGIVAIGALIGWLASHGAKIQPPSDNLPPVEASHAPAHPPENPPLKPLPPAQIPRPPVVTENPPATMPLATTTTNWEDTLDQILVSGTEDTNKVKQLFALFPTLPPEGQEDVAQHLSNLVSDEDYAQLGKLLLDAKLPESVLDVLIGDLLNRPNKVKLPMFLDISKTPNHPNAEESRDLLELFLDLEPPIDWNTVPQKMQEWLKENPD